MDINEYIAKNVMGLKQLVSGQKPEPTDFPYFKMLNFGIETEAPYPYCNFGTGRTFSFKPATEIKDAMWVLDHLANQGIVLLLKVDGLRPKERRYNVLDILGEYDNPCTAICMAAIKIFQDSNLPESVDETLDLLK